MKPRCKKYDKIYIPNTDEWFMIMDIRNDKGFIYYVCVGVAKSCGRGCTVLDSEVGVNVFTSKKDFTQALKKKKYVYNYKSPVQLTKEVTEAGYKVLLQEFQRNSEITC